MKKIFLFIVFTLLIELILKFNIINAYILPPPSKIISTGYLLLKNGQLVKHISISFLRVLSGFFLAFTFAFPLGVILGLKPNIHKFFEPILNFFRNVPPLALVPLIIIWFGIGEEAKMLVIILASFFPIFLNTKKGISSCDSKLIEVGKTFYFSEKDVFFKIILPSASSDILLGMKLALGYSWRAIIGAEMIAASSGLGYLILDGQQLFRPDVVIVGIISIGFLGIFTDYLLKLVIKKFLKGRFTHEEWI